MVRFFPAGALLAIFSSGHASTANRAGVAAGLDLQAPARPVSMQPGQWEVVTELNSVEAPSAPEELLEAMRSALAGQRTVQSQCVTPEQARDPMRNMMQSQNPAHCEFSQTTWEGGQIRVRGTCHPSDSAAVQLSVDGAYEGQQFNVGVSLHMELPDPAGSGPAQPIQVQGRITGRRTGDCAPPDPRANENSLAPVN